jgi:hypothetical protein
VGRGPDCLGATSKTQIPEFEPDQFLAYQLMFSGYFPVEVLILKIVEIVRALSYWRHWNI